MGKFPTLYEGSHDGSGLSSAEVGRFMNRRDQRQLEVQVSVMIRQSLTEAVQNELDARVNDHLQELQKNQLIQRAHRQKQIVVANTRDSLAATAEVHRLVQEYIRCHPELEPIALEVENRAINWLMSDQALDP